MRRNIFIALCFTALARSSATADSYAPFTNFREVDSTGQYYLVVKKVDGGPQDPGRGTQVNFELVERRKGSEPITEVSDTVASRHSVNSNPEVTVREGDKVLGKGTLIRCPGKILISSTGLGFAGLDVRGYNYGSVNSKDAVVFVGADGTVKHQLSIGDLYDANEQTKFARTGGGMSWLGGGWIDERRQQLVVVSSAWGKYEDHGRTAIPRLFRVVDLQSGVIQNASPKEVVTALADGSVGALQFAIDLAAELTIKEAHKDLLRHFENADLPVNLRLHACVALAALGDKSGEEFIKNAALAKDTKAYPDRYYAVTRLPFVIGDAAAPVLCEIVRRYEGNFRSASWQAMHAVSAKAAVPELIKLLDEKGPYERQCFAMECLGDKGPAAKDAVPSLIRVLRDPDMPGNLLSSQDFAALALGHIGPDAKDALEDLIRIAKLRAPDEWERVKNGNPERRLDPNNWRRYSEDAFVDAICRIREEKSPNEKAP